MIMPPKGRARGHIGDASYGKGTYGGRAASAGVVGGWDYLWDELHRKLHQTAKKANSAQKVVSALLGSALPP